jgi:hypothetical protein
MPILAIRFLPHREFCAIPLCMNWMDIVLQWRALPPERKQQLRWEAIPADVAQSMAFEGEPVEETAIREMLDRIARPGLSKPHAASSATRS